AAVWAVSGGSALVETCGARVGIEFRLLLLRRLLRRQWLLDIGLLFRLIRLLDLVGSRIRLRWVRLWLRCHFLGGLHFLFFRDLCLRVLDRLGWLFGFFLDQRLGAPDLERRPPPLWPLPG